MKSDIIIIDNRGKGFEDALKETKKVAEYTGLDHQDSLRLQLITEEMLSLIRLVTGEVQASFWLERDGKQYTLSLTTKTVMDKEKRELLIASSSSQKNEAAGSFLGKLRNLFEKAMTADAPGGDDLPEDVLDDLANHTIECSDEEWDGYEQSTLKKLADVIKIGIRGDYVEMNVIKTFA